MTTVAYKGGVIAVDGQTTSGETVVSRDEKKLIEIGGARFFCCGVVDDYGPFADACVNGGSTEGMDAAAIMVNEDGVFCVSIDGEGGVNKWRISGSWAIGSGEKYAQGAMDAGATAKEAVQIAAGRDVYTGGKIRTYRVAR